MQAELARARDLIARGELAAAGPLLAELLRRAPDDVNALNLGTVLALRTQDYPQALTLSAHALALLPGHPGLRGNRVLALTRYAEQCQQHNDFDLAAQSLLQALQLDANAAGARALLLTTAIAAVASGRRPEPTLVRWSDQQARALSVITCSIDADKEQRFEQSLHQHFSDVDLDLQVIHDARSLAEAYQRGLAQSCHPYVLFCHDDIAFARPDFAPRLFSALKQFDLVGVAGCTRLTGPSALWSGPEHAFCQIGQRDPSGQLFASLYGLGPERVTPAMALDGVFLACHRALAEQIGFDAERFDYFHLYDTDFSYRAHLAGFRVGIAQDLLLIHDSLGNFDARWQQYADLFLAKFPALAGQPAAAQRILLAPVADSDLLAVHTQLRAWLDPVYTASH